MSDIKMPDWIGFSFKGSGRKKIREVYCMHCMITEGPYEEGESIEDFVVQHSACTYPIAGTVVEIDPTGRNRFMDTIRLSHDLDAKDISVQAFPDGRSKTEPGDQPMPTVRDGSAFIVDLVKADLEKRASLGERRYGTRLQAHNGRDALLDAYEEACDLVCYLRQAIAEREG